MEKTKCHGGIRGVFFACIICIMFIYNSISVFAGTDTKYSQYMETVYDESNGLPTGEANQVIQTRDGYIWIASYGGLIRYNGRDFINYSELEHQLLSSSIRTLYEDSQGNLWIGSNDRGIFLYQDQRFTKAEEEGTKIEIGSVRQFVECGDGSVYGASMEGLFRMQTEEGHAKAVLVDGTENLQIISADADRNGDIWTVTRSGEIVIVRENGQAEPLILPEEYRKDFSYIYKDRKDRIHLGTQEKEVILMTPEGGDYQFSQYRTDEISNINFMYEDTDGKLWICGKTGLGYLLEDGTFHKLPGILDNPEITSVMEDYEGNYWASSSSNGLILLNEGKFKNTTRENALYGQTVNAMYQKNGRLYAATNRGLIILDESYEKMENELTRMLDNIRLRHICEDKEGKLWISAYGTYGAVCYDTERDQFQTFGEKEGLLSNQARMVLPLSNGTIAVAGNQGIDILEDGSIIRQYTEKDGLDIPGILCMLETRDGILYAGSDGGGIYAIEDGRVRHYGKDQGLETGVVLRMKEDPELDCLWISAGDDLYQMKDGAAQRLKTLHTGVGSVFDIQFTEDTIWLLKGNGVFSVSREELLKDNVTSITKAGREEGLGGTLIANAWNYMDTKGTLYLCTGNGISIFQTKEDYKEKVPLKGAIEDVIVDGFSCMSGDKIDIPHTAARVTFDIEVLSYTLDDCYVEYYLEGFDRRAIRVDTDQLDSVSYTNLPGGNYTFHMRVLNGDSVAGETDYNVEIYKELKLTERPWFGILLVLSLITLVAALCYVIARNKIRSLRKRQREYRSIINQSLSTFANTIDAKDGYTNGHSHRVAEYSREIARRMKMSEEDQEMLYYTALLHDIGKIGIPDEILKKKGSLTNEERDLIKNHPNIGGRILKDFTAIAGISEGARYHHENFDGTGYNEGLKGKEIPLYARIICIADSYDAMASRRCYREPLERDVIAREFRRCSGSQFDPDIVIYAIEMVEEGFVTEYERRSRL